MHESNFNYNQTQQVARERQRVELSSEGLYDIQALSVTVNTTELTLGSDDHPPLTFIVEWAGRQSDAFTFQELQDDTSKGNTMYSHSEHIVGGGWLQKEGNFRP